MSFLTADEVRAVRIRDSKLVPIVGTARAIRVVNMAASSGPLIQDLQLEIAAGTKKQTDLFLFMLQASCADEKGDLLTEADARELYGTLTQDEILGLISVVSSTVKKVDVGNSAASPVAA